MSRYIHKCGPPYQMGRAGVRRGSRETQSPPRAAPSAPSGQRGYLLLHSPQACGLHVVIDVHGSQTDNDILRLLSCLRSRALNAGRGHWALGRWGGGQGRKGPRVQGARTRAPEGREIRFASTKYLRAHCRAATSGSRPGSAGASPGAERLLAVITSHAVALALAAFRLRYGGEYVRVCVRERE